MSKYTIYENNALQLLIENVQSTKKLFDACPKKFNNITIIAGNKNIGKKTFLLQNIKIDCFIDILDKITFEEFKQIVIPIFAKNYKCIGISNIDYVDNLTRNTNLFYGSDFIFTVNNSMFAFDLACFRFRYRFKYLHLSFIPYYKFNVDYCAWLRQGGYLVDAEASREDILKAIQNIKETKLSNSKSFAVLHNALQFFQTEDCVDSYFTHLFNATILFIRDAINFSDKSSQDKQKALESLPKLPLQNNAIIDESLHESGLATWAPVVTVTCDGETHFGLTGMSYCTEATRELDYIFQEARFRSYFIDQILSTIDLSKFYFDIYKNLIFEDIIRHLNLQRTLKAKLFAAYKILDYTTHQMLLEVNHKLVTISDDCKLITYKNKTSEIGQFIKDICYEI